MAKPLNFFTMIHMSKAPCDAKVCAKITFLGMQNVCIMCLISREGTQTQLCTQALTLHSKSTESAVDYNRINSHSLERLQNI